MWAVLLLTGAAFAWWRERRRSGLSALDFLFYETVYIYCRLWHRWSCRLAARLPASGPMLIVSNHTCSADPTFIYAAMPRPVGYLMSVQHFNLNAFTHWVCRHLHCVPVRRDGRDPVALRQALRRLREGVALCIFPEGNLSGIAHEHILPGKMGTAFMALATRAPVFPVYIHGGPRTHHLLRSWLLPSPRAVRVFVGPPLDLSRFLERPRSHALYEELTAFVMHEIAGLRPRPPAPRMKKEAIVRDLLPVT